MTGTYLHWGVVQISATNLGIIVAMLIVFALAIAIPFPRPRAGRERRDRS